MASILSGKFVKATASCIAGALLIGVGITSVSAGGLACWFQSLDKNSDGYLDATEAKAACGKDASDADTTAWISARDTDKDGKVTFKEMQDHKDNA